MTAIRENILSELKCTSCGMYLSFPPIRINTNGDNICGRCITSKDTDDDKLYIRNKCYELLASTMKFPCRYNSYGCNYFPKWDCVKKHENTCEYRVMECPLRKINNPNCAWTGKCSEIYDHCKESHEDQTTSMNPVILQHNLQENNEKYMLISVSGFLFIIEIIIDRKSDKICHFVRYIGNPKCVKQFYMTLKISRKSATFANIIPVLPYDFEFKQTPPSAEGETEQEGPSEIQITGIETVLKGDEDLSFTMEINMKMDEDLLNEIKCIICKTLCKYNIFTIENKAVCKICAPSNCTEDQYLTSLALQILHPCVHKNKGCLKFDNIKNINKHEIFSCKYLSCFICLQVFECDLETHFREKHSIFVFGFEEMFQIDLQYELNWLVITNSESTLVCRYMFDEIYLNIYICANLSQEALSDCTCSLKIFDFEKKKSIIKNMYPIRKHVYDWSIQLNANDLFSVINNNKIYVQFELFKTVSA